MATPVHDCCPAAVELLRYGKPRVFLDPQTGDFFGQPRECWYLPAPHLDYAEWDGESVLVLHCPWCGLKLEPSRGELL